MKFVQLVLHIHRFCFYGFNQAQIENIWNKCSGLVHWEDPKGWDGEEGGKGIRMGNTCQSMAGSCLCMAKNTIIS